MSTLDFDESPIRRCTDCRLVTRAGTVDAIGHCPVCRADAFVTLQGYQCDECEAVYRDPTDASACCYDDV